MQEDEVTTIEAVEAEDVTVPVVDKPYVFPHATAAQWLAQDPILADGVMAIEVDPFTGTSKAKVGYQGKRWSQLPYLGEQNPAFALEATTADIPAPEVPGKVLISGGPDAMIWGDIDSGYFTEPTPMQPKILRTPFGAIPGPPATLSEGVLAVNLSGHSSGDSRAALYVGGFEGPVQLFSQQDTQAFVQVVSQVLRGGANVADAMNLMDVPITLVNGNLLVVYYTPDAPAEGVGHAPEEPVLTITGVVYLFTALAGRYGSVGYTGEGGPGLPVTQSQFFAVSQILEQG